MNEKQMQDVAASILLDEYTQLDVARLLKAHEEEEETGGLPDALDAKCTKLILREFAKNKRKKVCAEISKALSKVAMVTLMLIGLCTVSVLSVEAWREPVLQFVLETFDRRSSVSLEGEIFKDSKTPEYVIKQLTDTVSFDYKMVYEHTLDGNYQARYVGQSGEIVYLYIATNQEAMYFDTESTDGNELRINGHEAIFISKNGYKIIWLDEANELLIELSAMNIEENTFWTLIDKITS